MVRRIVIILIIIGDVISAVYCANIEHGNYGQSPQNGLQFGNSRNENNGYMHNFNQRTELPTYSPTETVKPRQTTGSSDKEEIDKVETKKLKELRNDIFSLKENLASLVDTQRLFLSSIRNTYEQARNSVGSYNSYSDDYGKPQNSGNYSPPPPPPPPAQPAASAYRPSSSYSTYAQTQPQQPQNVYLMPSQPPASVQTEPVKHKKVSLKKVKRVRLLHPIRQQFQAQSSDRSLVLLKHGLVKALWSAVVVGLVKLVPLFWILIKLLFRSFAPLGHHPFNHQYNGQYEQSPISHHQAFEEEYEDAVYEDQPDYEEEIHSSPY